MTPSPISRRRFIASTVAAASLSTVASAADNDNYDDAQYRQVFRELVKKYRLTHGQSRVRDAAC
jgi:hypothetical protein